MCSISELKDIISIRYEKKDTEDESTQKRGGKKTGVWVNEEILTTKKQKEDNVLHFQAEVMTFRRIGREKSYFFYLQRRKSREKKYSFVALSCMLSASNHRFCNRNNQTFAFHFFTDRKQKRKGKPRSRI
jgi:hypothetical protein